MCLFSLKNKIYYLIYLFLKFEKLQRRLWKKIRKYFNCHNFGYVQDSYTKHVRIGHFGILL